MAIKIVREPDIYLTEGEVLRYQKEYKDFMAYYAGPPVTFEEFVRGRKKEKKGDDHV